MPTDTNEKEITMIETATAQYRIAEPWEIVDHFKVNKWMLKIGAKWLFEADRPGASPDIGHLHGYWLLDGMEVSQKEAAKWYLAIHRQWWRFWS